ncbi:3-hydroxyacyl-CoA dehydrogenase/enoyl-CoA hydratase family protein [Leptolyngbya sp. FACHB-711]|uniref:3-hydroxyacyl-CoA dehydrogenase/enoyl-CoA hydratase family protein n=1 Tax=unclassified Leptolyngbya TaxID=2650499 RepID=UPI00168575AB|nr:3-hydroxyacyl-CoA dehydrogenase/enoyl-CoA hydratase family protein [Leptolyngbya sp. FACHB-711]MBD1852717.1 3-hydroxyacyl-CoA dehydrogenase/enoyl-CoA hydratase family protein [Cyanobacteria bacterium FACHB-502]MBD2026574.1 3-hydroxyacyl-CoA dehydrogenase/enoyl-CoA hydratase family protein [Leptolyngbya sp. FACHB-711]
MFQPFQTVAVLGAGVMGSQIAAHLANAGLTVHLLDLPGSEANKNDRVEALFKKALKLSPPICFTGKIIHRITLGNYEEHFHRLSGVDWVIEAVIEDLQIKQQLMERLEEVIRPDAVVSSNTSGLRIGSIAQHRSLSFRKRFLGTHFFNPPRYLKLLELIPTADTDPAVVECVQWFAEMHLGKAIVHAKDTPNFIANRIGVYVTMLGLQAWTQQGYTIEEIDTLTGALMGRPKSATFRTADLVGLDTLLAVLEHLYPALPDDESREIFQVPEILRKLVSTGTLGAKSGQGFYKKQQSQILSVNPVTLAYEPAQPMNLGDNLKAIAKIPDLHDRLRALYDDSSRAGDFFRQTILNILTYSARRIPEIADSPLETDRAMRWGFGWELGVFEIWDALGFQRILTALQTAHQSIPDWVLQMAEAGNDRFYQLEKAPLSDAQVSAPVPQISPSQQWQVYQPSNQPRGQYVPIPSPVDEINLSMLRSDPKRVVWQNAEAGLIDLDDGVLLYEFRSKGNTLSFKVIEGLTETLRILESDDNVKGVVIGNESDNFSGGANLAEIGMLAQSNPAAIAQLIEQFQSTLQRLHYAPKPIVAAIQGRVLGGGCELVMACPQVVAAAETYIGLVELSVGLIPGAGGIMRMVARAGERAATATPGHVQPFLHNAFETIATAKVSNSAEEAKELGFLPPTARIVMNGDRRLAIAKAEVLHLDRIGYLPPPRQPAILVAGRSGQAMLDHAAYVFEQAGYASEYDRYLAERLAYVMTGGMLSAPTQVSEEYLLRLERETFLPLLAQPKTQERIAHILKTKKPLRN